MCIRNGFPCGACVCAGGAGICFDYNGYIKIQLVKCAEHVTLFSQCVN